MPELTRDMRDLLRNALAEEHKGANGANGANGTARQKRPLKRHGRAATETNNVTESTTANGSNPMRSKKLLTPVQRQRELKANPPVLLEEGQRYLIHIESDDDDDDDDRDAKRESKRPKHFDKTEVVNLDDSDKKRSPLATSPTELESSGEEEDIDSDEFEDVDLDATFDDYTYGEQTTGEDDSINVTIKKHTRAEKKKQRSIMVDSEERNFRRTLHIMHLFIMMGHGVCRNSWISDPKLLVQLQKQIPRQIKSELKQYHEHRAKNNVTTQSKTRKLLDLLRHLMEWWQSAWKVNPRSPVLYKKTWNELRQPESVIPKHKQSMNQALFRVAILTHRGSRDIASQGFVALLRSINLPARLVFSMQPPDFTNMKRCEAFSNPENTNLVEETVSPLKKRTAVTPRRRGKRNGGETLLSRLRTKQKVYTNTPVQTEAQKAGEFADKYGAWPVFWAEVWDKDAKKHITVDPMVKKLIEVVSWKSKLEPPMNCIRNNSWYVVGYDRVGGVRDITRRYAKEYNAKVRKKRITREPKWDKWWCEALRGVCSSKRLKDNRVDKFEQIEFEEMGLKEGMPSNIGDFKGHPIYVLESDLKFNEILSPKISCGGLSNKGHTKKASDGFIPVYKREYVHVVRSARGWFMRGRVLKVGERPLKVREKKKAVGKRKRGTEDDFRLSDNDDGGDGEDEDAGRLYAEFQTEKYVPPPVENGKIPKNAFKNIDIYEPWMIPEGCVHVPNSYAEKAAKMMNIEYAPAVVGFDFKGARRDVSAKIEGIVTLSEYKDAVELLCQGLKEAEQEENRRREDLLNLRSWQILLTKLKIRKRLSADHGDISDFDDDGDDDDGKNREQYDDDNVHRDSADEEDENGGFEVGGFVPNFTPASSRTRSHVEASYAEFDEEGINERTDLSASDFEDDAGLPYADVYTSGLDITKPQRKGMIEMTDKRHGGNGKMKESESTFGNGGILSAQDESDMVYNPDEERRYDDSGSESSDFNADDDRMDQLDKEFAELADDDHLDDSIKPHNGSTVTNKSKAVEQKDVETEGGNKDEDYEFEYSD